MGISQIANYGMYTQYPTREIKQVDVNELAISDTQVQSQIEPDKEEIQSRREAVSRTANLENISLTFNANDSFEHIGREADITNLDVTRAISDMQKDEVLLRYNTFTDQANDFVKEFQDGTVIMK